MTQSLKEFYDKQPEYVKALPCYEIYVVEIEKDRGPGEKYAYFDRGLARQHAGDAVLSDNGKVRVRTIIVYGEPTQRPEMYEDLRRQQESIIAE